MRFFPRRRAKASGTCEVVPFPEILVVRIERRALRLTAEGETEADYAVLVDDEEACAGTVSLPVHEPHAGACDLVEAVRTMVLKAALANLLGLRTAVLAVAQDPDDESDAPAPPAKEKAN